MFAYARPRNLDETLALLRDEPEAKVLCGGTDLLVALRKGTVRPPLVIDLKRVVELASEIHEADGVLRIGANTVMTRVIADDRVQRHFPALVEAAMVVGSIQIRNRATLAGNLCNASPAADTVPPLLVYGAVVELTSEAGARRVPLTEFFIGPGQTVLRAGELVTAVELPLPEEPVGSAFGRMTRRRGVDLATVNLSCAVSSDGTTRFAFGAVGPRAFLAVDDSGTLADASAGREAQHDVLHRLTSEATPISNVRASREYRQDMLLVLSRRAVELSRRRLDEARRAV